MNISLATAFILSLFALLFCSSFFPSVHLLYFTPYLTLVSLRTSLLPSLWLSCLAGLCVDLFASQLLFGLTALNYSLTLLLLSTQKRNFIEDKPISFLLFAALVSTLSSGIQLLFHALFGQTIPFSLGLVYTDLIISPLLDGLYAQILLALPFYLWRNLRNSITKRSTR